MHKQSVKRRTQRWRSRKRSYLPHVKDIILCLNKIWQHSLCCSSKSQAIEAVIQPQGLSASPTTLASCLCFPLLRSTVWKFKSLTVIHILREIYCGELETSTYQFQLFHVKSEWQKNSRIFTLCKVKTKINCRMRVVEMIFFLLKDYCKTSINLFVLGIYHTVWKNRIPLSFEK